ncbi:hypothetical protein [Campylobacter portucalensis]|uniref:hypothetical protein n=1 Tax=Campylobacter portucalensis TaxID=2608384 RepID=UPI001E3D3499|nr:hypothetical protein [Campylobacter portucalensis]
MIFEICVLCRVEDSKEQRLEFVRRFNIINFSFYPNEPYFRHFFSYFGDEIYNTHPGFREDEKGSFINLGYQKRLKNR